MTYTLTSFPIFNILVCMKSEVEGLMAEPINIGGKVILGAQTASSTAHPAITQTQSSKTLTICRGACSIDALQRGVAEKLTAEIFDPATAGGYDLYRYTTRYVRKGLYEAWLGTERQQQYCSGQGTS